MDRTQKPPRTSDAITHGKSANEAVTKGHTTRDRQNVPTKKQIDDYIQKEEERNNQIAANLKNTHSFARLASQLGEWEEKIDGKGEMKRDG